MNLLHVRKPRLNKVPSTQRPLLLCSAWSLQLHDPPAPTSDAARRAVQETYLREHLGPWLISQPEKLRDAHSWHLMRYHGPSSIVVSFRVLGTEEVLNRADPAIRKTLEEHRSGGIVAAMVQEPRGVWETSILPNYGGPAVAEPWARFLAASSMLTVELLIQEPRQDIREQVVAHWLHCCSLITEGTG